MAFLCFLVVKCDACFRPYGFSAAFSLIAACLEFTKRGSQGLSQLGIYPNGVVTLNPVCTFCLQACGPDVPMWLVRSDGHMGVASSTALNMAGVTRDTQAPQVSCLYVSTSMLPCSLFKKFSRY